MIAIHQLHKHFNGQIAVDGIDVSIPAGVVCGLVGPNGAGKTTTMRCLCGLLPPSDGRVEVAGVDAQQDPVTLKRRVAYVPDDPPLFDELSVGQHLDFIATLYGIDDHRATALSWLERFALLDRYDAIVSTLSRGMRQKVALACAYLSAPRVLLLDEPLTGLDPPAIRDVLDSVLAFARRGGTVIVSSHLLAMIQDVCDQVMVMQSGRVVFHGTSDQLRKTYTGANTLEQAFFAATEATRSAAGATIDTASIPADTGVAAV